MSSPTDPSHDESAELTPFDVLALSAGGDLASGRARVDQIAQRFYDVMEEREPILYERLLTVQPNRKVGNEMIFTQPDVAEPYAAPVLLKRLLNSNDPVAVRLAVSLFLLGWLGGPAEYEARHGHPRLRMRHARVPIDLAMRDAWLRCMDQALTDCGVTGELRAFLDERFAHVANFLRNIEG